VQDGEEPLFALALVVSLAILREGAETVLFLYGQKAQGTPIPEIFFGSAAGLVGGIAVGVALYVGLLRIPVRHLFRVTSWMILLLAAGMASQAVKFLVQADWLPGWGRLWDSSWLLSNTSVTGRLLHALIGYDAVPMGSQLAAYIATLLVILAGMYWVESRHRSVSA
jgi:high-affinity iron transporter